MATTKLKLRPDKKGRTGEIGIYVQVCIESRVKLFPTGQKIDQKYWNEKEQKVKKINGSNHHREINLLLEKKHQEIKNIIFHREVNGDKISFEDISESLQPKEVNPTEFNHWFEKFIESKSSQYKTGTLRHYRVLQNQLNDFINDKKLDLEKIDFGFFNDFKNWLITDKKQTNSTVNKRLKILKTFLRFCSDYDVYDAGRLTKFKMLEEKVSTKIALTQEELYKLWNHDFSDNIRLDKVRDLFVFACTTGLRESDIQNLTKSNIVDNEISLNVIKTSAEIKIPLNDYSMAILEKYNYKLPKLSQQKLNSYLKEVGMAVGIDAPQNVVKFQAGKRYESTVPRFELLKSHVGRRTFITLSIIKGIPIPIIQSMTGHKDLASFQKYIQIGSKSKIEAMKSWRI